MLGRVERLVSIGVFIYALGCTSAPTLAQGTLTKITFDGPPLIAPGTGKVVQQFSEGGMSFTPIDPNAPWAGFTRNGGGIFGYPDNGTAYLQAGVASTLKFTSVDGSPFDLVSVDLAGYSDVVPDATVSFVGYRRDGTLVATNITVRGITFETFIFDSAFKELDRVEIPTEPWSLDNLAVWRGVPEPGTDALVGIGVAALGIRRLRRRCSRASNSEKRHLLDLYRAAPYPAEYCVSGQPSSISKVTVTLNHFKHPRAKWGSEQSFSTSQVPQA